MLGLFAWRCAVNIACEVTCGNVTWVGVHGVLILRQWSDFTTNPLSAAAASIN